MKIALILGTNAGQADIIEYLKSIKWEVHACGHARVGPGCDLADHFHLVSTIDVHAVTDLAKSIKADLVYSVSSDLAIKTATKVSENLKLPHLLNSALIELFDDKIKLREFLNKENLSPVDFMEVMSVNEIEKW